MPEGDTIFRSARALGRALVGKPITGFRSTYPLLTRFDDETPLLGQVVDNVESRGKWLLIHFSGGATLATHMLMSGSWHIYRPGEQWQRPGGDMRIVLENSEFVAVGFTVPVAKMLTPHELERALKAPIAGMPRSRTMIPLISASAVDVLSDDFDPGEVERRIRARRDEAIGDVLLNQSVFAGVGNVFKSEICFVTATNPFCLVSDLEGGKISALIATARTLMKANVLVESGNAIVTYGGRKRRTTHASDPGANLWVYGRAGEACRICGAPIQSRIQGRNVRITYWCPHCQPTCGGADAR